MLWQEYLQRGLGYNYPRAKFNWTGQSIKWYLESERTTDFYKRSLEILGPYMKDCNSLFDIGCGIGSFALEFAKRGFDVTAIDKSNMAIEVLRERIRAMELDSIEAQPIAFEDFKFNSSYDIILLSYMAGLVDEANIMKVLQYTRQLVVAILPFDDIKNDFYIRELYYKLGISTLNLKQPNYQEIVDILDRKHIKYDLRIFKAEFGQPFENIYEAMFFIYHYFNLPKERWKDVRDWLNKKLIKKDASLYLPSVRKSAMVIIEV